MHKYTEKLLNCNKKNLKKKTNTSKKPKQANKQAKNEYKTNQTKPKKKAKNKTKTGQSIWLSFPLFGRNMRDHIY